MAVLLLTQPVNNWPLSVCCKRYCQLNTKMPRPGPAPLHASLNTLSEPVHKTAVGPAALNKTVDEIGHADVWKMLPSMTGIFQKNSNELTAC